VSDKFTKREAKILLEWAKSGMDCDTSQNMAPEGCLIATYGTSDLKAVKKIWKTIIKKLRSVQ